MDIFPGTLYTLLERLPFCLPWSNTCLRDVYRTRRVLKCILEAHFMRSAVPVLVILSLTHANQKYRKNVVAYTFWHHYRTNFVETKFFSHYSEPSCGLQSVVNARPPPPPPPPPRPPPVNNIPCADSELRYIKLQHVHYVEAELWHFKSQNILHVVPYAMARMPWVRRGHRPLSQSHLGGAVIYCSILAVAPTGIFCVFSQILSSSNKSADVWQGSGH